MPRTGRALLAALTLACAVPARGMINTLAPQTWERDEKGQWRQVDAPPGPGRDAGAPAVAAPQDAVAPADRTVQNAELDRVESLLAARKARAAREPIIRWIKANPTAADRDRGLFLLAEMYDQNGDKLRAFYHLDELLDYHPESRLFYPALEKQYAISDRFLEGYKRRFLGIPFLTADDEGVEILFRIQERAPGSPIAERALLRTADHYYDASQFDLAADAYAAYARSYPRSPDVPRVRLRQAFSSLAQFRGLRFDATPVIDAKAQLEDIQAEYPELSREENVGDVLERIDGILAARVAQTADFYRRTREPQAAVYNWRYIVENYPESAEAERARRQLERAPAWALELPAPAKGRGTTEEQLRTPSPAEPGATTPPAGNPAGAGTGGAERANPEVEPPSIQTPSEDETQ